MQKTVAWLPNLFTRTSVLITGLGVGWLLGLSVSPVVSIVITSVAGAAGAIIAAISGLEGKSSGLIGPNQQEIPASLQKFSPWPLTIFVIGIIAGSMLGITARNRHWFGSSVSAEIAQWTKFGITEQVVANRLFEQYYPYSPYVRTLDWLGGDLTAEVKRWTDAGMPKEEAARRLFEVEYLDVSSSASSITTTHTDSRFDSILFAAAVQEECKSLTTLVEKRNYNSIQTELLSSATPPLRELATIVTDTVKLAQIVEKVICAESQP